MKISTLALGALISFSTSAFAQNKIAKKDTISTAKTTKCNKEKSKTKNDSLNSQLKSNPKHHKARYCPACGMG